MFILLFFQRILFLSFLFYIGASCHRKPTVYLIRHGEKPKVGNGLNADGKRRAQCLREVFGHKSEYKIDYILSPSYSHGGKRKRAYDTVVPLAKDLGIHIDTSCGREDHKCVAKKIKKHTGHGNILISWQHENMAKIVKYLGAKHVKEYPDDRYDLIWTVPSPYSKITSKDSENCPTLDMMTEDEL